MLFDKKRVGPKADPFIGQNLTQIEERISESIITVKCDKKIAYPHRCLVLPVEGHRKRIVYKSDVDVVVLFKLLWWFFLRIEMGKEVGATHSKGVFNLKSGVFGQISCGLL